MDDRRPATIADRFALAVSAGCSPYVVLPVFIGLLAVERTPDARQAWLWGGISACGLVGVPLLYIGLGVARGTLSDIHIDRREQRRGPFLAAMLGAALAALLLDLTHAPLEFPLAAAAMVLNGALFLLISMWWKISVHPSVLAACAVLTGILVSPTYLWVLLAVPVVIWARVRRQRHSWAQGLLATVLSAGTTGAMVYIYVAHHGGL